MKINTTISILLFVAFFIYAFDYQSTPQRLLDREIPKIYCVPDVETIYPDSNLIG